MKPQTKQAIKKHANTLTEISLYTTYLLTTLTFFYALLNGGSITITINQYGEQYLELIFFAITLPLVFLRLLSPSRLKS